MRETVKAIYDCLDSFSGHYKTPEQIQNDVANAEFRRDAAREEKMVAQMEGEGND